MALSFNLVGFPIFILLISFISGNGGVFLNPNSNLNGAVVVFNGQPSPGNSQYQTFDCSGFVFQIIGGTGPCMSNLPVYGQILCNNDPVTGASCYILNFCPNPFPSNVGGLWCNPVLGKTFLQPGVTATFTGGTGTTNSASVITAVFGVIGPTGFVAMLIVAVSLAGLLALNVLGSGESGEGVHILFQGGVFIGFWFILSAAEGFIAGNSNSFFSQLDKAIAGFGTSFYVILTLLYTIGVMGVISRGGGS